MWISTLSTRQILKNSKNVLDYIIYFWIVLTWIHFNILDIIHRLSSVQGSQLFGNWFCFYLQAKKWLNLMYRLQRVIPYHKYSDIINSAQRCLSHIIFYLWLWFSATLNLVNAYEFLHLNGFCSWRKFIVVFRNSQKAVCIMQVTFAMSAMSPHSFLITTFNLRLFFKYESAVLHDVALNYAFCTEKYLD